MRINEILTESEIHQLNEGPMLDKAGTLVGKAVGGAAKGVGAVAGGIAGIGRAFKKGYAGGKAVVGGDPSPNADEPETAPAPVKPAPGPAPTPAPVDPKATPKPGPAPTPAPVEDPKAKQVSQTLYAQVKSNIDKLDKKGKQRILQLLQKSVQQPPTKPPTKPAAGAGAMDAMAGQLAKGGAAEPNTMANAPVSKTNTAKPGNPNAAPAADTTAAPADTTATPPAVTPPAATPPAGTTPAAEVPVKKKRAPKKPAAPSQAEIDADRERNMGVTSDSIIRKHVSLAETLMQAIAKEKSRMVAEGKISIFRK